MDANFIPKLKELSQKYSVADITNAELLDGAVRIDCDKGAFCFFYDFNKDWQMDGVVSAPLFHWQLKRKYSELRGLLDRKMITPALAMRIHHIVPHDAFTRSLKDIIVFETNLLEFITRSKVNKVFADFSGEIYTNCIMSTDTNVKASMELGFSPDKSEPVLLHEVVARTGVASDLPVDIQMVQYPIYVIKGEETKVYNEIDFELYGMDNTEADCIRFILWALTDISRVDELKADYARAEKVYEAAVESTANLKYTEVEG